MSQFGSWLEQTAAVCSLRFRRDYGGNKDVGNKLGRAGAERVQLCDSSVTLTIIAELHSAPAGPKLNP